MKGIGALGKFSLIKRDTFYDMSFSSFMASLDITKCKTSEISNDYVDENLKFIDSQNS